MKEMKQIEQSGLEKKCDSAFAMAEDMKGITILVVVVIEH